MSRFYIAMAESQSDGTEPEVFRTKREAERWLSEPYFRTKESDIDTETGETIEENSWERVIYTVEIGTTKKEQMAAARQLLCRGMQHENSLCGDPGGPIEYRRMDR
jgi:hypothetical protein